MDNCTLPCVEKEGVSTCGGVKAEKEIGSDRDSESSISLHLCLPGKLIKVVSVHKDSSIRRLLKFTQSASCSFVYSGTFLSEGMSFGFYGIQNNDYIVALSNEPGEAMSQTTKHMWSSITKDYDAFKEKLKVMSDPKTSAEFARLHDLRFFKMSDNPATFRRMCAAYQMNSANLRPEPRAQSTILDATLERPSKDPLPTPWIANEPEEEVA